MYLYSSAAPGWGGEDGQAALKCPKDNPQNLLKFDQKVWEEEIFKKEI